MRNHTETFEKGHANIFFDEHKGTEVRRPAKIKIFQLGKVAQEDFCFRNTFFLKHCSAQCCDF